MDVDRFWYFSKIARESFFINRIRDVLRVPIFENGYKAETQPRRASRVVQPIGGDLLSTIPLDLRLNFISHSTQAEITVTRSTRSPDEKKQY